MTVDFPLNTTKIQLKMYDCWYACIIMIRSAVVGSRVDGAGATAAQYRSAITGQRLSFTSSTGQEIIRENGLIDVANRIRLDRIQTLAKTMETYGPLIVSGMFALFNRYGHCMVIHGVNTDTGEIKIYDPGWCKGETTKPWSYITTYVHKVTGSDDTPVAGSFVAQDPAPFFDQPTRPHCRP